jgi:hypothetical protein
MALAEDSNWWNYASCQNSSVDFFPDIADLSEVRKAKKVCQQDCAVREECLEEALANRPTDGIWAGLTHVEISRAGSMYKALSSNLAPVVITKQPFVLRTTKSFSLRAF